MANGSDFNGVSFLNKGHLKYLYFSTDGRINLQRFWVGSVLSIILTFIAIWIGGILIAIGVFAALNERLPVVIDVIIAVIGGIIIIAAYIFVGIAVIKLYIKRAHDLDQPGQYVRRAMIPIAGLSVAIELAFHNGTIGRNSFGDDPRA